MAKKYKTFAEADWGETQKDINKLKKALDLKLNSKGKIKAGDNVFVDYYCLQDVLNFIDDIKRDIETMVKIRGVLDL